MNTPIVYLAGPLGFSEAGRLFHNTVLVPLIKEIGFDIRDPWTLTSTEMIDAVFNLPYGQKKKQAMVEMNQVIGCNNLMAIKESDLIVAVLDGVDIDSGTAAEIGCGYALRKMVIGYRGDFRLSSENEGGIVNVQVQYFIELSGGKIVTSVESLKKALVEYKNSFFQP